MVCPAIRLPRGIRRGCPSAGKLCRMRAMNSATTDGNQRIIGVIRTGLIGYGIAAYSYFVMGAGSRSQAEALGDTGASAASYLLWGVGMQILLIVAHALIKRSIPDESLAAQARWIVELIADGVTVFLFALATFGGILHAADQL
jgi:hypothetical protein